MFDNQGTPNPLATVDHTPPLPPSTSTTASDDKKNKNKNMIPTGWSPMVMATPTTHRFSNSNGWTHYSRLVRCDGQLYSYGHNLFQCYNDHDHTWHSLPCNDAFATPMNNVLIGIDTHMDPLTHTMVHGYILQLRLAPTPTPTPTITDSSDENGASSPPPSSSSSSVSATMRFIPAAVAAAGTASTTMSVTSTMNDMWIRNPTEIFLPQPLPPAIFVVYSSPSSSSLPLSSTNTGNNGIGTLDRLLVAYVSIREYSFASSSWLPPKPNWKIPNGVSPSGMVYLRDQGVLLIIGSGVNQYKVSASSYVSSIAMEMTNQCYTLDITSPDSTWRTRLLPVPLRSHSAGAFGPSATLWT